jgi:hypothetical protein
VVKLFDIDAYSSFGGGGLATSLPWFSEIGGISRDGKPRGVVLSRRAETENPPQLLGWADRGPTL